MRAARESLLASLGRRWARTPRHPVRLLALLAAFVAAGADARESADGRSLYDMHCSMCHGAGGEGAMAGTPDFRRGDALLRSDQSLLKRIQEGKNVCPSYWGVLSEQEILAVIVQLRRLKR